MIDAARAQELVELRIRERVGAVLPKYRPARALEARVELATRGSFALHVCELDAEQTGVLDEAVGRRQHRSDLARRHGLPPAGVEKLLLEVDDEERDLRMVVDRNAFPGSGSLAAGERERQAAGDERRTLQFHSAVR